MSIANYLNHGFTSVNGWCVPHLWNVIEPIHRFQESLSICNPIAEIGVYHGKFFIGLALTKLGHGKHYAIDVFDMQQFNLDGAGQGNLVTFKENCYRNGLREEDIHIVRADSMSLTPAAIIKIREETGGFSLFSVDGCHTVEHTINDFSIAMDLTCPEGIIFVDDYTNSDWPGVSEGMAKLYHMSSPRFVPLLLTCNKLLTCHISYHARLLEELNTFILSNYPTSRIKKVKRFGYDCLNVHPNTNLTEYVKSI